MNHLVRCFAVLIAAASPMGSVAQATDTMGIVNDFNAFVYVTAWTRAKGNDKWIKLVDASNYGQAKFVLDVGGSRVWLFTNFHPKKSRQFKFEFVCDAWPRSLKRDDKSIWTRDVILPSANAFYSVPGNKVWRIEGGVKAACCNPRPEFRTLSLQQAPGAPSKGKLNNFVDTVCAAN